MGGSSSSEKKKIKEIRDVKEIKETPYNTTSSSSYNTTSYNTAPTTSTTTTVTTTTTSSSSSSSSTSSGSLGQKAADSNKTATESASDKVQKLFDKYADKTDKEIMSESGMIQFFSDVGVNPEGYEPLVVAWSLNSSEMGLLQRKEFVEGFTAQGCTTIADLKKIIREKVGLLASETQFRHFYKWVFQHAKEDEKQKTIPTNLAVQLWKIVLSGKQKDLTLLSLWLEWCEQTEDFKAVNKDIWEQVYDFLKETKNLQSYDDSGAWPVEVDEFIAWSKRK